MENCYLFSTDVHSRTKVNKVLQQNCVFIKECTDIVSKISTIEKGSIIIVDLSANYAYLKILFSNQENNDYKIIILCPKNLMNGYVVTKLGNYTCLSKPFSEHELASALNLKEDKSQKQQNLEDLFIGISENAQNVRVKAKEYSLTDKPVFIYGETGTGKEIISRYITGGKEEDSIYVDCGLLNSSLAESAIFGAKKGSFTGSDRDIVGYVEQANGKALVFDEIENLSLQSQSQLLRFIQDGSYRRIGEYSCSPRYSKCKLISISNKNPIELITNGILREDLFHRINYHTISIKPLRERKEDIPLLIRYWEDKQNYDRIIDDYTFFIDKRWRGNARQLFSVVDYIHRESRGLDHFKYSLPEHYI